MCMSMYVCVYMCVLCLREREREKERDRGFLFLCSKEGLSDPKDKKQK